MSDGEANIAKVGVEFDASGALAGRDQTVKSFEDIAKAAQQHSATTSSSWNKAFEMLKTGAMALGIGFGAIMSVGFVKQAIDAAAEYERLGG